MKKLIVEFLKENNGAFCTFIDKWYHGDYNDVELKYTHDADGFKCVVRSEWDDDAVFETTILAIELLILLVDKLENSSLNIYK